ncbi:transcriptional regulator, TetR family [Sphingobium faniae]|nr:transcriptional regulator, TetR family [Sphingobium faniae]
MNGGSASLETPMTRGSRAQILAAALSCLEATGLRGTRVEDVLREAKVSRATFYRHFPNIDAVIIELAVAAARNALARAVADSQAPGVDSATRIARVIAGMAGRISDPPILAMLASSDQLLRISNLIMGTDHAMAILSAPIVPLLDAGRADGTLRADIDNAQMVEWLTRNATSIRSRLPPHARTPAQLEAYVTRFVMPGLLAQQPAGLDVVLDRLDAIERRLGG